MNAGVLEPVPACGTLLALRTVTRRVQQLTAEERALAGQMEKRTTTPASQLLNQPGIGPQLAGLAL